LGFHFSKLDQCLPKYSSPSNGQANLRTHPLQNSNWSIPKAKIFRFEIFWIEHSVLFILSDPTDKWIDWTHRVLASRSSSILLNGVPGSHFHCKRDVKQGDPLSPLLFVLAADLLQCIVNEGFQDGLFELPVPSYDLAHSPLSSMQMTHS